MQLRRLYAFAYATLLACVGCTCSPKSLPPAAGEAGPAAADLAHGGVVNLATWSNYIPPSLLMQFEQQYKLRVEVSNYSSNEELLAKLQAGATGYDVVVPSDYMIHVMIKLGLLEPIDRALVPSALEIDAQFVGKSYDPENLYSLPYVWIATGIAVHRDLYKGPIKGWTDLLRNPQIHGKLSLLDDVRETLGAALKMNGHSLNTHAADELFKAKQVIAALRPHVKAFTSDPIPAITGGDVAVAHMYSSDALQAARATNGKVEFVIPSEGCTMAIDSMAIPKGARNIAGAHTLINFLLSPDIYPQIISGILAGPVLKGSREQLPEALQNNPTLFPAPSVFARFEMMQDAGDTAMLYDKIWTELKVGGDH